MKAISTKKKTLNPKTGESIVIEDKSMRGQRQQKNTSQLTEEEKRESLTKLESDVLAAQYDISDYIKRHNEWAANPMIIRNQADVATYMYCMKLDIACMEPLAKGIDSNSIAEAIGMSIGMRMASKEYKQYKQAEKAEKKMAKREKWVERFDKLSAISIPYGYIMGDGQIYEGKMTIPGVEEMKSFAEWNRDKNIKKTHGGTLPLTPESAAITYIGLAKSAYNDMREPGANVQDVYKKFETAKDMLYEQAAYDKVSKNAIDGNVRDIVGKMAEKYPDMDMAVFEEISDASVKLENGKLLKQDGSEYKGTLEPRKPKTKEEYENTLRNAFSEMYSECQNIQDINNIDFQKNGFAAEMDSMRQRYCADLGNKRDIVKVNDEFNELYSGVAVDELNKWGKQDEKRAKEMEAFFEHMNKTAGPAQQEHSEKQASPKKASQMLSPELLEVAGFDNQADNGYGMER